MPQPSSPSSIHKSRQANYEPLNICVSLSGLILTVFIKREDEQKKTVLKIKICTNFRSDKYSIHLCRLCEWGRLFSRWSPDNGADDTIAYRGQWLIASKSSQSSIRIRFRAFRFIFFLRFASCIMWPWGKNEPRSGAYTNSEFPSRPKNCTKRDF